MNLGFVSTVHTRIAEAKYEEILASFRKNSISINYKLNERTNLPINHVPF